MSVEVLVAKPLPTITVGSSKTNGSQALESDSSKILKERSGRQLPQCAETVSHCVDAPTLYSRSGDSLKQKIGSANYTNDPQNPASKYDNRSQLNGQAVVSRHQRFQHHHNNQLPVGRQNFDFTHIIYDAASDTTYLQGRLLGKGGFARCYELLSLSNNKVYAGKIISKSRISKPHQKQKIIREVGLQKELRHKNVVEFHSYFEDDSNVYIVLENCSRKSLVHVMKHRKVLTEPEVRFYLLRLVEGVKYIHHHHNIIHRDLKLGNMLLNESMELKLADFGLATRVDFEGEQKMTVCGTPNYIAPEVLQKKGHSFEADIWAIGCIMYALLVGRPPFETTSLKETYLRITENSYIMPSHISSAASFLIKKCLHSVPHLRPSLEDIRTDVFFTGAFVPRSLSPSCCTVLPKFSSQLTEASDSGPNTPFAPPSDVRADPLSHVSNALSRMQLNSHSENLLEEKELEAIEKRSPCRFKPECPGAVVSAPVISMERKSGGKHANGPLLQRGTSVKGRLASTLLEMLTSGLERMPRGRDRNPATVVDADVVWVTKWVDYSNKYGFGFMLSNDALGVLFNDTSRMLTSPDGQSVQYSDMTSKLYAYSLDSVPEGLECKTTLLQYFARYMEEHLIQGGDLDGPNYRDPLWSLSLYLKKWFRTTKAIVLYLSDGTLQVNFFEDHTKLILSLVKGEYLVMFIDSERCAKTYHMDVLLQDGCRSDIFDRMMFACSMLKNLVDLEGDNM